MLAAGLPGLGQTTAAPTAAPTAQPIAADAAGIGTVRAVTGTGGLGRQEPLAQMQTGMDVFAGDRARTAAQSRAHLGFGPATELFLGPDSEVIVDAFIAGSGGVIYLDGALLFDRAEGAAGSDPEAEADIVTDYGRIGVRGTRFFISPGVDGLAIFVERGAVVVTGTDPAQTEVPLAAGEGTLITAPGVAPNPAGIWGSARINAITRAVLGDAGP